jgi:Domain of unknown function (DUF4345)
MATASMSTVGRDEGHFLIRVVAPVFSRMVMILPMLVMVLIAIRFISNPAHGAAPTGVTLSTPEAVTDTRVVGALALTIAFVLASAIVSSQRLRLGHLTVIALMAFILAVRLFGFAQDGTTFTTGTQKFKMTGELVFLALNTLGFALQIFVLRRNGARQ